MKMNTKGVIKMATQFLTFRKKRMSSLEKRSYPRHSTFSKPRENSILAKRKYGIVYIGKEINNETIKKTPSED